MNLVLFEVGLEEIEHVKLNWVLSLVLSGQRINIKGSNILASPFFLFRFVPALKDENQYIFLFLKFNDNIKNKDISYFPSLLFSSLPYPW